MRPERLYLLDVLEAIRDIEQMTAGREMSLIVSDAVARRAVLHALITIGEAASHLSARFRRRHPQVPWKQVVAFRNVVVHEYFALDWNIIWDLMRVEVPELKAMIEGIYRAEFPE